MSRIISPSFLSADFAFLHRDITTINESNADWLHLDIMDGVFVPNISFGFPVLKYIAQYAGKPLDVHLMIVNPDKFIEEFKKLGTYMLTVHYEACMHLHRTVQSIKQAGMKAGVALNPHTPINVLEDIIHDLDMVLIMTVNPGFGGQNFIEHSYKKIRKLKQLITEAGASTLIQVDGGVSLQNADALCEAGVDVLVAGNAIFKAESPRDTIDAMKHLQE